VTFSSSPGTSSRDGFKALDAILHWQQCRCRSRISRCYEGEDLLIMTPGKPRSSCLPSFWHSNPLDRDMLDPSSAQGSVELFLPRAAHVVPSAWPLACLLPARSRAATRECDSVNGKLDAAGKACRS